MISALREHHDRFRDTLSSIDRNVSGINAVPSITSLISRCACHGSSSVRASGSHAFTIWSARDRYWSLVPRAQSIIVGAANKPIASPSSRKASRCEEERLKDRLARNARRLFSDASVSCSRNLPDRHPRRSVETGGTRAWCNFDPSVCREWSAVDVNGPHWLLVLGHAGYPHAQLRKNNNSSRQQLDQFRRTERPDNPTTNLVRVVPNGVHFTAFAGL